MLDPITSLAFSMHATKGVYAVLLGSGVSRAAKIPTGWEVTLDLVRQLAAVQGADCGADPEAWFRDRTQQSPDYSVLLDGLARTPAERQQILRRYWEPTEEERQEGAKLPTAAHRALAGLVRGGYVRVILTTNFDRLTEIALQEEGVQPTVISSVDHITGAMPLIHNPCTVVKLHGDYMDTRIRNTQTELSEYPEPLNTLLDRVFDEFGLVVCGWSADWDPALRAAITRAPSRRFSLYWGARGQPGRVAAELIQHRAGHLVSIQDADSFFLELREKVDALVAFAQPHPLSTEAAVASLKKYLSSPLHRIQLDELIGRELQRVHEATGEPAFAVTSAPIDSATVTQRVKSYEAVCETLIHMAYVAGRWCDAQQADVWCKALAEFAEGRAGSGFTFWIDLTRYPATLLLYSFGLGAVESGNLKVLARMLSVSVQSHNNSEVRAVARVVPHRLVSRGIETMRTLEGMERHYAPLSDWLHNRLRLPARRDFRQDGAFTLAFDKLEVLLALNCMEGANTPGVRYPLGAFGYRRSNLSRILAGLRAEIARDGAGALLVGSGVIGPTPAECSLRIDALEADCRELNWF